MPDILTRAKDFAFKRSQTDETVPIPAQRHSGSSQGREIAATATPETIRVSLLGLSDAEIDHLRQIQKEVAERPSDENAMESACGEYNCPCHYQIGFLLEVIAKATTISLPALRAIIFDAIDAKTWRFYWHEWANSDTAETEATEHCREFVDLICDRLRQLPGQAEREE